MSFLKSQIPILKVLYSTLKNASWGRDFVTKMRQLANIWDVWTKFQNFFTIASWGVWLLVDKKFLVPGLPGCTGHGRKVPRVEPSFDENMKMTIFMYVTPKKLNCLRVICMSCGPKNFFDLTDPHLAYLGTHRHPCGMPSRCPQRANFLDSWGISKISKTNNISGKFWIFFDQVDPVGTLGSPGYPQWVPN